MSKGMNKNTNMSTVKLIQQIGTDINWSEQKASRLCQAILTLKTKDEVERFLRDLLTPTEIAEFANRFEAARLLSQDVQYESIIESTGLSSTTIARIAKWLNGSLGGYRLVISRLVKHHNNSSPQRKGLRLNS